jgi:hypothetical protein
MTLFLAWWSPDRRVLLRRMIAFEKTLPARFDQPLPVMMADLTPDTRSESSLPADQVRQLADAVAAWRFQSPLGICLRRSLVRYHFLREMGVPVAIVFGARIKRESEGGGVGGHAWLTLNGRPYYEDPQNYRDFVTMFTYPERTISATLSSPRGDN